jgi:hypothetical protein
MMSSDRDGALAAICRELAAAARDLLAARGQGPDAGRLYGLLFVVSPQGTYALVAAGTEEGLASTASGYEAKGYRATDGGDAGQLLRAGLRWAGPDDGWLGQDGPWCDAANGLIAEARDRGHLGDDDGVLEGICLQALADLDVSGAFGGEEERAKVVLGLSYGSQSEQEFLAWADRVNPPPVRERLRAELAAADAAWGRIASPGRRD